MDAEPRFHTTLRQIDGAVVVVKMARGSDVGPLRHEARTLTALSHVGIVRVVASGGDGQRFGLATAHAGSQSLATIPPRPPAVAAHIAGQVLDAVGHVHACGVVHRRIEPTHVVVGPDDRVALCGFRSTGPISTDAMLRDIADAASLGIAVLESAAHNVPRRTRRTTMRLLDTCRALLADHRPGATTMARRIDDAVTQFVLASGGSTQSQRHLVGQQPSGNSQHQAISARDHQSVEHPGHVLGP